MPVPYYQSQVDVRPTGASPIQAVSRPSALTQIAQTVGVLAETVDRLGEAARSQRIMAEQQKQREGAVAVDEFKDNYYRLANLAHDNKDPSILQDYLNTAAQHPNVDVRAAANSAALQYKKELEQQQKENATAAKVAANEARIAAERQKSEAESTAKTAADNVEKYMIGDRTLKRERSFSTDSFLNPNRLHAEAFAAVNDEIIKVTSAMGITVETDKNGLITDPVLRSMVEKQAFNLSSRQLESDGKFQRELQTKSVENDVTSIAFSSTTDDVGQLKKGLEVIAANSPIGTESDHVGKLVTGRVAAIVSSVNTAERTPQKAIEALSSVRDFLRSNPDIGNRFDDTLLKATDTIMDRFKDSISASVKAVSGSKIGQNSTALMERLPSGEYKIDKLLTEYAKQLKLPAIGQPQSIFDFDMTNADPAQRMMLAKLQEVRTEIQAEAVKETGWTPHQKTENEAEKSWRVGAGPALTPTEQNKAWAATSIVESLGRKDTSADDVAKLVAMSGAPLTSADDVLNQIKAGTPPEFIVVAAGKADAQAMVKNRSVPPRAAENMANQLRSQNPVDVLSAQSTIAGLGGPSSQLFLNSLTGGDEEKGTVLAHALALGSLFAAEDATPVDLNWFSTYDQLRQNIQKADLSKNASSKIFDRLYGGSVGAPREERMFKALSGAGLLPASATYSGTAMFLDPAVYGAVEELAAGFVLKYPQLEPNHAWTAAVNVLRSNGIQFVQNGKAVTTVYDPWRHYEQPEKAAERIGGELRRVVPTHSNEEVQLREQFDIPPEKDTRGWTTWDYIKEGVPDLRAYNLDDYKIDVDYSGFGGDHFLQVNNQYVPTKNLPDVNNTWFGGGGVLLFTLKDSNNFVSVPVIGKSGTPFQWSLHRQSLPGIRSYPKTDQYFSFKASPESEKVRLSGKDSPWPNPINWGPKK